MLNTPSPHPPREIEAETATRRGYSHVYNEDASLVDIERGLFVVADGMGGHRDGHVASNAIIADLQQAPAPLQSFEDRIEQAMRAIEKTNARLHAESLADPESGISGSTVVSLIIGDNYACCLWVGDSRLYLLRGQRLYLISQDHAADNGALTRAVGSTAKLDIERRLVEIADGDLFLLCSDGLLKGMSEDDLVAILSANQGHAADRLLAKSVAGGSLDDITLILVWIDRHD